MDFEEIRELEHRYNEIKTTLTSLFLKKKTRGIFAIEIYKIIEPIISDEIIQKIINDILNPDEINIFQKLDFLSFLFQKNHITPFFNIYKQLLFQLDHDQIFKETISIQRSIIPYFQSTIVWQSGPDEIHEIVIMTRDINRSGDLYHKYKCQDIIKKEQLSIDDVYKNIPDYDELYIGNHVLYKQSPGSDFMILQYYKYSGYHIRGLDGSELELIGKEEASTNDYYHDILLSVFPELITPYKLELSAFILSSIYKWILQKMVYDFLFSIIHDHEMDKTLQEQATNLFKTHLSFFHMRQNYLYL